jgi:hypothetical protein
MGGRFRSSRMDETVLDEGMRKGMDEMRDEMKGILWKIERSRDISPEGLKSMVLKGFESMSRVMENAIRRVWDKLAEEGRRKDRGEREMDERISRLEERKVYKERTQEIDERKREERMHQVEKTAEVLGIEERKREERMQKLERKVRDEEVGGKKVSETMTMLIGKVNVLWKEKEDKEGLYRQERDERLEKESLDSERMMAMEDSLKALETIVKEREKSEVQEREKMQEELRKGRLHESRNLAGCEIMEGEGTVADKMKKIEEGLEREREIRMRMEEERKEEREIRVREESVKEMERKVSESMENLKIMNLKFKKGTKEKLELLKEAEEIITRKVKEEERKECEWILHKSKVYILGKGTEEKDVGGERIFTAPVLVKCGSQVERERLERMLRGTGVVVTVYWPKEILEFVYEIRGDVEQMGYRKEDYFIKVRPYKVDGVPQLRAEVKRMGDKGGAFKRVAAWSCPPADKRIW